jgi:hypothetical protein
VTEHPGSWDKNLPWAKFSYNNSYQESLKTTPFEVLYECHCRTVLNWIEPGEKVTFGPDIVEEAVTPGFKAKPDAHRMYAQDQVVIHTVRM